MKELKFHYAAAKNVFCFGEDGIELFFKDYGKIVLISGENFDDVDERGKPGSNGSGKSSVADILCLALFGETIKDMHIKDIIHNKVEKNGYAEVIWDSYRVVRTFAPSSLKMWDSKDHIWDKKTEISKGKSMGETEKLIEDKLGFNYHAFVNVTIFDDRNQFAFLESDTPTKRKIVESLLYLQQYAAHCANAKNLHKQQKEIVKLTSKDYENIKAVIADAKKRLTQTQVSDASWLANKKSEIEGLVNQIKEKQSKLESADVAPEVKRYQEAQDKIVDITTQQIPTLEANKNKIVDLVKDVKIKIGDLTSNNQTTSSLLLEAKSNISNFNKDIKNNEDLIESIKNLAHGQKCPTCYGLVDRDTSHYVVDHAKKMIDSLTVSLEKEQAFFDRTRENYQTTNDSIKKLQTSVEAADAKIKTYNAKIESLHKELSELNKIQKPQLETELRVLEESICQLKKNLEDKKGELDRGSPYKEIILDAKKHLKDKEEEELSIQKKIQEAELAIKYIVYWEKAFGDEGIRKMVIEKVTPSLNDRVAYWLQFLIDNRITLKFNESLEPTIERNPPDGNPFVYKAMSRGEKRKLNLSISQAFAYITLLSRGCCPSVVFLDEISGGNIDYNGIPGVYSMLCELSKERQVFVTTHDSHLLSLLQGCENIVLRKKNGVTKIVT